jgi:hypothetical protein
MLIGPANSFHHCSNHYSIKNNTGKSNQNGDQSSDRGLRDNIAETDA